MVKRYGAVVTGRCTTCGRETRTEMTHIISQGRIRSAGRRTLEYLAHDVLDRMHDMSDDEIRRVLINSNPRNIVEMCRECHRQTDSHIKWRENMRKKRVKSPLRAVLLPMGVTPTDKCRAMKKNGRGRCKKRPGSRVPKRAEADQLCSMHRRSASSKRRPWPTITQEQMENPELLES